MEPRSHIFEPSHGSAVALHYLAWGEPDKPCIVLLHGGGANARWWAHVAPDLAAHHRVLALDFRGHGDSHHPQELAVGGFNDDLEAFLERVAGSDALVVGHSMGGRIALDHASRHTDLRGLVLVDVPFKLASRARRTTRLALALRRTYRSREEAIARFRFLPPARHASEALRVSIATHSVREMPDGRFAYNFDPRWFSLPPRPRADLSAVRCPTLLVQGGESELLDEESAEAFARQLPTAQVAAVARAGHHVFLDQPEGFLRALEGFLGGIES